jgi:hypothetical protein
MKAAGNTVNEILTNLPPDRVEPFNKLHDVIVKNLPEAAISYGGLGYVVPHSVYPAGYHCKPAEPLPFAGISSQKNSINFYPRHQNRGSGSPWLQYLPELPAASFHCP